ncbi:hypothetical protein [[Acholeplasma] multilocale]|uniref:hypothetical protein n=1 Tax=[Acholeplasma] multilocale TaxID=264638 RepID=UPI00047EFA8F|nr:hypothetical protein [[Acholeplasma] multilocale]
MNLSKKDQKTVKANSQRKWQFNKRFKASNMCILICGGLGMAAGTILFFMGVLWLLLSSSAINSEANKEILEKYSTKGLWALICGLYMLMMCALSVTLSASAMSNKTTSAKVLIEVIAIGSVVCMAGGIWMIFTQEVDKTEITAIEASQELEAIESIVEDKLDETVTDEEREQKVYDAKYIKAVEFLNQIKAGDIDEEKLVSRFSADFKVIFFEAKKQMILDGQFVEKEKSIDNVIVAENDDENIIVVNKDVTVEEVKENDDEDQGFFSRRNK